MAFRLTVQYKGESKVRLFRNVPMHVSENVKANWQWPDLAGSFSILREADHFQLRVDATSLTLDGSVYQKGDVIDLHHHNEFTMNDHTFRFELEQQRYQVKQKPGRIALVAQIMVAMIFVVEFFVVFVLPKQLTESRVFARNVTLQKSTRLLDNLRHQTTDHSYLYQNASPTMRSLIVMIKEDLDKQAWLLRNSSESLSLREVEKIHTHLEEYQFSIKYLTQRTIDVLKYLKTEKALLAEGKKIPADLRKPRDFDGLERLDSKTVMHAVDLYLKKTQR